jgi:hypothetical protein
MAFSVSVNPSQGLLWFNVSAKTDNKNSIRGRFQLPTGIDNLLSLINMTTQQTTLYRSILQMECSKTGERNGAEQADKDKC